LAFAIAPLSARAETSYDAWLRHAPIADAAKRAQYDALPAVVVALGDSSPVIAAARDEVVRTVHGALGRTLRIERAPPRAPAIILGTLRALKVQQPALAAALRAPADLPDDAYVIRSMATPPNLVIAAANERGVLYGALAFARKIDLGEPIAALDETQIPYAPVRMLDHWDNLDGTIERGYAGPSIFFEHDAVAADLSRVRDYARLMASVGINACSINNVNANPRVITPEFLPQLARVADAFRPWGVRLFVSIDFSSPKRIGGLDTFDPLDARVVAFWKSTVDGIYRAIPDFGGFVLKADSE